MTRPRRSQASTVEQFTSAVSSLAIRDRAVRAAVIGLLLAGPALGGWAVYTAETSPAGQPATTIQAAADGPSGFAQLYLAAWLHAGKGVEQTLRGYYPALVSLSRPAGEHAASQVVALAASQVGPGYWSIQVAADQLVAAGGGWQPAGIHCYQIPVAVTGPPNAGGPTPATATGEEPGVVATGYVATGLPAETSCPRGLELPRLDYGPTVGTSTGPIGDTLTAFLGAYLAGAGEVDRYITPGADLTAVTPAPYTAVAVDSVALRGLHGLDADDLDMTVVPDDDTAVEALVAVEATDQAQQVTPMTYVLTLTARAGRWEVTALNPAPALAEPPAAPTDPGPPTTTPPTPPGPAASTTPPSGA